MLKDKEHVILWMKELKNCGPNRKWKTVECLFSIMVDERILFFVCCSRDFVVVTIFLHFQGRTDVLNENAKFKISFHSRETNWQWKYSFNSRSKFALLGTALLKHFYKPFFFNWKSWSRTVDCVKLKEVCFTSSGRQGFIVIWKCVSLTSRNHFVGFKGLALEIFCVYCLLSLIFLHVIQICCCNLGKIEKLRELVLKKKGLKTCFFYFS